MDKKPFGKLKVVGTEFKQIRDLSVYTTIILEDEKGYKFEYKTAAMLWELKKVD